MPGIQLRAFQDASVEQLRNNIRAGIRSQVLSAPTGSGKCHAAGTHVLMADGTTRAVEDVRIGDRLLGPDGGPRFVQNLGRGHGPLFRVIPTKGDPYTCNADHILSLRKTPGSDGIRLPSGRHISARADVVHATVAELIAATDTARQCLKGWRAQAVDFPDAPTGYCDALPPYILGAWLGDGTARLSAISKPPCNLVMEWIAYCRSVGCKVRNTASEGRCPTWYATTDARGPGSNPVLESLRELDVLNNKHIPHAYKTAPARERLELLAGLLDSDGHCDRGGYDWISYSETLANDLAFVARSLGLACYVSPCRKTCTNTGKVGNYWRCSISGDCERIPCRDKKASPRLQKKRHLVHGIRIEPVGDGDYFGFVIDGDRQYLLSDFTVTHNTICAAYLLDECYNKRRKAVFVADRISLIDQTSAVLDHYGIPHGVIQANHWRTRPWERVQVASADTLARRGWPEFDLLIVDECHTQKETTRRVLLNLPPKAVAIGLTATPFSKGLGVSFKAVVSVTTTNRLIEEGHLCRYRVFAASEPDMEGAKVVAGEWTDAEAEKRSMPIIGDCVAEYLKHAPDTKFIAFGVSVAHCEEIQKQFMAAGVHCALYTYQNENERGKWVEEFRKPDSYIRGLISVSALAKGFDVSDVETIIVARPLRSSLAEHIQMLGRGLRSHPGKKMCTILDHSGNCVRFWDDTNDFFENGASELDDGTRKPVEKKRDAKEKKPRKCPKCFRVHDPAPACPNCGYAYPRTSNVSHVAGELSEVGSRGKSATAAQKQDIYSQLLYIARDRNRSDGWVAHTYRDRFGVWPAPSLMRIPKQPTREVEGWVKSRIIAHFRSKAGAR